MLLSTLSTLSTNGQLWRITADSLPTITRPCNHCGKLVPFYCAEKFRVNAQAKKLDVWLIYRCRNCDSRWNRPIYDRISPRQLNSSEYEQLLANHVGLAREIALSKNGLKAMGAQLSFTGAFCLDIAMKVNAPPWTIELSLEPHLEVRLDRIIAQGFSLSRQKVQQLWKQGAFIVDPTDKKGLRRPAKHGQRITVVQAQEELGQFWSSLG